MPDNETLNKSSESTTVPNFGTGTTYDGPNKALSRSSAQASSPPEVGSDDDGDDDEEEEEDFVQKYGSIQVVYIKKPKHSPWWTRPYALNYFYNGTLYRTRGERGSGVLELFLDLLYVGIVANLASEATENASAASFLKYCLMFLAIFTVWSDIREFMNYYFNNDLTQRIYMLWIILLLTVFVNNAPNVLDSRKATAMCVVPYMLCRLSLAISLFWYSLFIPEHRTQMVTYGSSLFVTTLLWTVVIFVGTRAKVGVSIALYTLDILCQIFSLHPYIKKNVMKLEYSTAVNIEHEVERYSAFYIIAIGEFLVKVVQGSPAGFGFNVKLWRALLVAVIGYIFVWLYFNGNGSVKATHALRRNSHSAPLWLYAHLPLIAGLILSADAVGDLIEADNSSTAKHSEAVHEAAVFLRRTVEAAGEAATEAASEGEASPSHYALAIFFTGGICLALFMLTLIAFLDRAEETINGLPTHRISKFWRLVFRIPAGIIILCLSFAEMEITRLIGLTTMILGVLFVYESVAVVPIHRGDNQREVVDDNGIAVLAEAGGERSNSAVEKESKRSASSRRA